MEDSPTHLCCVLVAYGGQSQSTSPSPLVRQSGRKFVRALGIGLEYCHNSNLNCLGL